MTRTSEADRLRQCREIFALAIAENLSMAAARSELARRRWAAIDARLASRRCGTLAEPIDTPAPRNQPWMMRD